MNTLFAHLHDVYVPTVQVLWPSLVTAAAMAIAGAVVGVFVALRREALMTLAMPQVVTLGAAAGLRLGIPTVIPAAGAAIAAMGLVSLQRKRDSANQLLPVLYVAGATVSVLAVAGSGNELIEVQNLFMGIDVAVPVETAVVTSTALIVLSLACALFWRRWMLLAQAPVAAELAGARPGLWNTTFLGILAAVLTIGTNAVGSIFVVAMLVLPAAIVLPWARRVPPAIVAAILVAIAVFGIGFVMSVEMDWPLTHAVGGTGVAIFLLSRSASAMRRSGFH